MQDTRLGKFRKAYNVKLIAMMVGLGLAGGIAVAKEATAEMKVPAMDCAAPLRTRRKRSNTCAISSGGIPSPVSATVISA